MTQSFSFKRVAISAAIVVAAAFAVAAEPAVRHEGDASASDYQYFVSNIGDGCAGCCYTGYCCSIPTLCGET